MQRKQKDDRRQLPRHWLANEGPGLKQYIWLLKGSLEWLQSLVKSALYIMVNNIFCLQMIEVSYK